MKTRMPLRRYAVSAAAALMALLVCIVFAAGTALATTSSENDDQNGDTTASTVTTTAQADDNGELEFKVSASATSVKVGKKFDIVLSMLNNSIYSVSDFTCRLNYDNNSIGISDFSKSSDACVLSATQAQPYVEVNFVARDGMAGYEAIPVGGKAEITLTMFVKNEAADIRELKFSVSDAKAFLRSDLSKQTTAAANLSHTFTFKQMPEIKMDVAGYSDDADLTSIIPYANDAELEMTPKFSSDILNYNVTVTYAIPSFKFTWTKSDSNAKVSYEPPSELAVGDNIFKFVVTAEDGTTSKIYTATVRRLKEGETKATTKITAESDTTSSTSGTTSGSESATGTSATEADAAAGITSTTASSTVTTTTETLDFGLTDQTDPYGQENVTDYAQPNIGGDEEKSGISLTLGALLGLVGFQLLLFALAYLSGYISHKNASKSSRRR